MAAGNEASNRRRRRLTVSERCQVFLDVVSGQGSQRDVADKWRIDPFHGGARVQDLVDHGVGWSLRRAWADAGDPCAVGLGTQRDHRGV